MTERRKFSKQEREEIYEKMHGRCAYCGSALDINDMQVDHIVPLHRGGTNDMNNLMPACRGCNHYKSTLTIEQFRAMVADIPDRLFAHGSAAYKMAIRTGLIKVNKPIKNNFRFYYERVDEIMDRINSEYSAQNPPQERYGYTMDNWATDMDYGGFYYPNLYLINYDTKNLMNPIDNTYCFNKEYWKWNVIKRMDLDRYTAVLFIKKP